MNADMVAKIANAILYEGYLLYPYRASAVKNQQRFNFGVLCPREHCELQQGSDAWEMQTECLVKSDAETRLAVRVRFLQMVEREGRQEGLEREIGVPDCGLRSLRAEPRAQAREENAEVELGATRVEEGLYRIQLVIRNCAELDSTRATTRPSTRDDVLLRSMISVHSILQVTGAEFVSLLDPPGQFRAAAAECRNVGTFPVLAGDPGQRDLLLSSPIILYDYPEIAPESPGDLFDGLEIDEILALRILTLTEEEKLEVRNGDQRARAILERTEMLPMEHFQKLHGALRGLRESSEGAA
jgi:hydrogenase maturation protease